MNPIPEPESSIARMLTWAPSERARTRQAELKKALVLPRLILEVSPWCEDDLLQISRGTGWLADANWTTPPGGAAWI